MDVRRDDASIDLTATRWRMVLRNCGVRPSVVEEWVPLFVQYVQPSKFSQGAREIDDFVGQVLHETGRLERLEENLNYRPQRLCEVWPSRFIGLESARPYAYNAEALANYVYGKRMGNDQPGDGYRYRGRGIPMVTGKANYALLEQLTGLPLIADPDSLAKPEPALRCAVLWWEKKVPDDAIDTCERVSRAVNGGDIGLDDRVWLTNKAAEALR